jgi:uncharacterized membrane protein YraQ (UPF0718 family)
MSSQLQDALGMFAFLAIELSVLFIGISLLVGVLQRHIPPSKVEALLTSSGKRGYFLAAGLGAITPFCSCSTIPMLKGLILHGGVAATVGLRKLEVTTPSPITERHHDDRGQDGID